MRNVVLFFLLSLFIIVIGCGSDDVIENNEDLYNLGALPDIVTDLEWPIQPNITVQRAVTSNKEFQEAVSTDGVSAIIANGVYDGVDLTCNDCEFILAKGAEIRGSLTFTGTRIRWNGGFVRKGPVVMNSKGDITIDNLHSITNGGELNNFSGPVGGWNRVALINSTIEVVNGDFSGDWALFVQGKNGTDFRGRNFILANVRLESDAQNNRFQSIQNLVVVDSYFNSNINAKNGLRIHQGCEDVFMRDVIIVGANTNSGEEIQIKNGVFRRITRYNDINNHFSNGIGFNTTNVTINDSQCYTASSNGVGEPPALGVASGTNPDMKTWDGVTVPEASTFGADH